MLHLKLDNLIKDIDKDNILPFKYFTFTGGEEHIQIDTEFCPPLSYMHSFEVLIEISLINSSKIMQLLVATDALKRIGFPYISLFAPYLPYARQDRICNPGEALSVKVICDLLNSQNYDKVYTLDNHSEVSTALLNNHREINLVPILKRKMALPDCLVLVSPDAGALKKTYKLAKQLGKEETIIIEAGKIRDVTNGKILKTVIHDNRVLCNDLHFIIDDICDGGATFIELAKALKQRGVKKVVLFVSHGIFSKGLEVFDGLIDEVFTTKSFKNSITDKIGADFNANDL